MSEIQFICHRCWRTPALSETNYLCPQCALRKRDDDDWLQFDSGNGFKHTAELLKRSWFRSESTKDGLPCCPDHPETEVKLFCPCEGYLPLSSVLQRGESQALGFAGPQGAGKTVMILTMVHAFQSLPGSDPITPQVALLGLGDTDTAFQSLADRLRNGEKPERTHPEPPLAVGGVARSLPRNFCWRVSLSGPRRSHRRGMLAVYDVAGETWGESGDRSFEMLDRYLGICNSLVFLVDGVAIARDLGIEVRDVWDDGTRRGDQGAMDRQWLGRLADRLQPKRASRSRLALVISKADLLWNEPQWQKLRPEKGTEESREEALGELLRISGRGALLTMAADDFHEVRLFAASSLGFTPTEEKVRQGNLVDPPKPTGVVEPILWLLEGA